MQYALFRSRRPVRRIGPNPGRTGWPRCRYRLYRNPDTSVLYLPCVRISLATGFSRDFFVPAGSIDRPEAISFRTRATCCL